MKNRFLIILVAGISGTMLAVMMIPNPALTMLLYPYEHGEIPEIRAFYDKFGHSVEIATGDDHIVAFLNQNNHVYTTLIVFKDTNNNNNDSNHDSRITCAKGKDVHSITKDVIAFLKDYDCFGSKPYPHSPADSYKIP